MEEHQSCPICFETPSQEIYQCVGGHTICHTCVVNLSECPQCRVPYGSQKIRNRALEQILDKQTFDCLNAGGGCKEKLKRQDILKHAESCSKRSISLCKMLGYQHCPYVLDPSIRSAIIKHMTEEHGIVHECKTNVNVWHGDFKSTIEASNLSNQMWNPTLLTGDTDWYTESTYEAKFLLKSAATDQPLATWIIPVFNVLDNGHDYSNLLQISPCEVPFWFIKNICKNIDDIPLSVQTQPTTRERKGNQEANAGVWTYSTETKLAADLDNASGALGSHPSVGCDGCLQEPIIGKRHKCLQCEDYDLCENCMAAGQHAHHIFVGLATPEQAQDFRSILAIRVRTDQNRQTQDVVALPTPNVDIVYPNITCNACRIRNFSGKQYKCLQCADYDLCESCKLSGIHSSHIFIIVRTFEQRQLVRQSFQRIRIPELPPSLMQLSGFSARTNVMVDDVVCPNVTCNGCRNRPIIGYQYKCLQCPNFDLCGRCMSGGVHSFHLFIIISNLNQRKLIRLLFVRIW